MKMLLVPVLILAGCASGVYENSTRVNLLQYGIEPSPSTVRSEQYLAEIIVPRVTFDGSNLQRAVDTLNQISTDLPDDFPKIILLEMDEVKGMTVSFRELDASLLTIIDTMCRSAGLRWWIDGNVFVTPAARLPDTLDHAYPPERRTRQIGNY
jgi:hypothetical protein